VDNVFLSKTAGQEFSIIEPYVLHIEGSMEAPAFPRIKNEGQ
jgi:hypothetical protein